MNAFCKFITSIYRISGRLPVLLLVPCSILAQMPDFHRNTSVQVIHADTEMDYPWAGGFHNPQFSSIDLNGDEVEDLFVFDKINNQILTFINNGTPNSIDYTFAPEYVAAFPDLHDWALLLDYTQDGLPDIFTYGLAGIRVFKTTRLPDNNLTFELTSEQLRFDSFSGSLNILSNGSELPAFIDVNNDGDIDVLTFDFIGRYIEYYENQSQELTGTADDTLWFERVTACWGKFSESANDNSVNLMDDCGDWLAPFPTEIAKQQLHSGSTILALDFNNDGVKELILGDVSHGNLVKLTNGGTPEEAEMIAVDNNFPVDDIPVNLPIFPASFYLDVDNDGKKDLIAAINERNNGISENHVWLYKNTGTEEFPVFTRQTESFLFDNMIDAGLRSYPVWADVNQDGLADIVVGNLGNYDLEDATYYASLTLLLNTGTQVNPRFELISNDFGNLLQYNSRGLFPALGDLDGDFDLDMLVADETGMLHYFENTALTGELAQLTLTHPDFLEVPEADAVTPFLFDVDNDGALDLICGERAGKLNYFRNTTAETGALSFTLVSDFWGQVDVRQSGTPFGYSAPAIAVADSSGLPYLFVNSESGHIHVYSGLTEPVFTHLSDNLSAIREGGRGGIALTDLQNNAGFDMLVGNARGGLGLFSQTGNPVDTTTISVPPSFSPKQAFTIFPSPAKNGAFNLLLPNAGFSQNLNIRFFNLQGLEIKGVACHILPNRQSIEVQMPAGLPSGLYLIGLTTPNDRVTLKIMIE